MTTDTFAVALIVLCAIVLAIGFMLIQIAIRRRDEENDALNQQLLFDEELHR